MLSAAADRKSTISGTIGVKMSGPYDYVPPEYWHLDKDKVGGAFGFNTETTPVRPFLCHRRYGAPCPRRAGRQLTINGGITQAWESLLSMTSSIKA